MIRATTITEAVVAGVFPIPRHLCVANVAWSMLSYEADLIAVTDRGYVIEVEVKVSLTDLKRDAAKAKWRSRDFREKVSRFYYAMPAALWEKTAAQACVPEFAGVIVVGDDRRARVIREAKRQEARALNDRERYDLARVGSFRAWSPAMKHRQRQLQALREFEAEKRKAERQRWFDDRQKQQAAA